jgi:Tfp pilus assembly protein PilF
MLTVATLGTGACGSGKPAAPDAVAVKALGLLNEGRQSDAEALLQTTIERDPEIGPVLPLMSVTPKKAEGKIQAIGAAKLQGKQRVVFLAAACQRSRFDIDNAAPLFRLVRLIDPTTPEGECAACILSLDAPNAVNASTDGSLARLRNLVEANGDDPILRWMIAVECRHLNRNEEGVKHYEELLKKWSPGPVLVHQTYANLLDAIKQHERALEQRQIAVKLEPAGWAYDGLGNTLHALGRLKEASEAAAEAIRLEPDRESYWTNWAGTLLQDGEIDAAIRKCERAIALDPASYRALFFWGRCLEAQGKTAEALALYRRSLASDPGQPTDIRERIARVEKELKAPQS